VKRRNVKWKVGSGACRARSAVSSRIAAPCAQRSLTWRPIWHRLIRRVNGLPALVAEDPAPNRPNAPRVVLLIDLARDGKIRSVFSVLAPGMLGNVHWPRLGPA